MVLIPGVDVNVVLVFVLVTLVERKLQGWLELCVMMLMFLLKEEEE